MSVNCRSVDGTPTAGRSVADLHPRQRADGQNSRPSGGPITPCWLGSHSDVGRILKTFYGVCDTDNPV